MQIFLLLWYFNRAVLKCWKLSFIAFSVSESETNSCEINDNKKLTVESGRKSGCSPESTVTLDDIIEIVKQKFSTENDDGPKEIKDVVFWTVDEKTANDTGEMKDVKNPEKIPMSNFENELLDSDDDSFVVGEPPSIITEEDDIDLLIRFFLFLCFT